MPNMMMADTADEDVYVFPMSFAQQRLWFLDQLEPDSAFYNMPGVVRLCGALQLPALEASFNEIVRRHEVLRTTFAMVDGQPVQVITPQQQHSIPVVDLSPLPPAEREVEAQRLTAEEIHRPFDVVSGPLMRVHLLILSEQEHLLLVIIHHIICDGWSIDILIHELAALYEAFRVGHPSPLPELSVQYADFAHWQRQWLQGEVLEEQLGYWTRQLTGAPQVLALSTDHPRPAAQTYRGATYHFAWPQSLTDQLQSLGRQQGVTLFMLLLAAFKLLLRSETRGEDIVVGTDVANRNRTEIEGVVGFFVNQLVLRTDLSGNPTFREVLERVREVTLGAYAHQDLPFERLVAALRPARSLQHAPLFQVKLILQPAALPSIELPDLSFLPLEGERETAELDLLLSFSEVSGTLHGSFEYATDLFEQTTIERFLRQLTTILRHVVTHPESRLATLDTLLSTVERQQRSEEVKQRTGANVKRLKNIRRKAIQIPQRQGKAHNETVGF